MSEENNNTQNQTNQTQPPQVEVQQANKEVDSNEKMIAALAYILFFIPLITEPKTEFKTFHANQGLLLLIFWVGGSIISSILAIILIGILTGIFVGIFGFIAFIIGIVNAFNGKMHRLPLIGQWDLLK